MIIKLNEGKSVPYLGRSRAETIVRRNPDYSQRFKYVYYDATDKMTDDQFLEFYNILASGEADDLLNASQLEYDSLFKDMTWTPELIDWFYRDDPYEEEKEEFSSEFLGKPININDLYGDYIYPEDYLLDMPGIPDQNKINFASTLFIGDERLDPEDASELYLTYLPKSCGSIFGMNTSSSPKTSKDKGSFIRVYKDLDEPFDQTDFENFKKEFPQKSYNTKGDRLVAVIQYLCDNNLSINEFFSDKVQSEVAEKAKAAKYIQKKFWELPYDSKNSTGYDHTPVKYKGKTYTTNYGETKEFGNPDTIYRVWKYGKEVLQDYLNGKITTSKVNYKPDERYVPAFLRR